MNQRIENLAVKKKWRLLVAVFNILVKVYLRNIPAHNVVQNSSIWLNISFSDITVRAVISPGDSGRGVEGSAAAALLYSAMRNHCGRILVMTAVKAVNVTRPARTK